MNKYIYLGVAFAAATLLSACHAGHNHGPEEHAEADANNHEHEHGADEITFTPEQAKAAGLKVESMKPADFAEVVEVSGRVLPAPGAEATIAATMAGIVRFPQADLTDGKPVSKGQSLFVVEAGQMADGNPAAAAQAELTAAKQALDRAQRLAADKIISQRELEDAQQRYQAAAAAAKSLGGASQTRSVAAPIGGYLKSVLVKPGDYVAAGQPLAMVTQSRKLQLRADVPERHYAMLSRIVGANFRMAYDKTSVTYSVKELGGRLLSKGQASDSGDYFVPVTFEFNNQGNIVPGSFAQVYLEGNTRSGILSVPVEALTEAQGLYFVYIQIHGDAYRRQEVRLGASNGRRTEILSGLKAGDKVVVAGATQVRLAANATVVPEGHTH